MPNTQGPKRLNAPVVRSASDDLLHLLSHALWWAVTPIILAFHLDHFLLHLFRLSIPLFLAHLRLLVEELHIWLPVASTQSVPERRVLAVVVVEVQVVHRVASGTVDHGTVRNVLSVVDHDRPDIDEGEKRNVGELLQWEDEWEEVVWHTLAVAIKRVEGVAGVWRRHDPLVVWLVQCLVDTRVV